MVIGFKALLVAFTGTPYEAALWLLLTLIIDSVDGTLARICRVDQVLPNFDGKMIDFVIDWVNFVITPVVVFYRTQLVPEPVLFPCVALIIFASLFHYGNRKQVTEDMYFLGFPAFWNLVLYYLFILEMSTWCNAIVVAAFAVLHFVPFKILYFSRITNKDIPTILAVVCTVISNMVILLVYPDVRLWMKLSAVVPLLYLLLAPNMKQKGSVLNQAGQPT